MLILHVITNLAPNGAELMLKRLTAAHRGDERFEHQVISLMGTGVVGPMLEAQGVHVEALGMKSAVDLPRVFVRLIKAMRRRRPDIVQTWMYHADLIGGLAARTAGVATVLWGVRIADIERRMGVGRATIWIRRACARLSRHIPDRIIYVADAARLVHERLGYDRRKSIVIVNGYDLPAALDPTGLRAEIGIAPEAVIVGSAGRFSGQKDQRTFVAAASILARTQTEFRFVMMGEGNTPENHELRHWIETGGAAERFHLLGQRRDLIDCLAGLDIFCLHSIGEGFPNVVAEAMSSGVPCVVTDVGDSAFLVGDTGVVVPPQDPQALAEAIGGLAHIGSVGRHSLGERARKRIAAKFSIGSVSQLYAELYESLMTVRAPQTRRRKSRPNHAK